MLPSPVFNRNMKNLLTGILGLLAVIHPAYVNTVILTEPESDDLQDSMKDEFLIPSLATQLPKRNTTIQSFSVSSDHKESVTHAQGFTSTVVSVDKVDSRSDVPNLGTSELLPESTPANEEVLQNKFLEHVHSILPSELGSGEGEMQELYPVVANASPEVSTIFSASTAPPTFGTSEKLSESTPAKEEILQNKFLEHVHSILPSELGSGEGEMQEQYPVVSTAGPEVSTTFSASTAPPTFGTSEKLSESTPAEEEILQNKFLGHVHSILPPELESGEGEMQGPHPTTSSARPDVSTTLSETTLLTTRAGEGSHSELETTEKLSDPTPVEEEILQNKFLGHVHSILPSESGSGEGEMQGRHPATSSARPDVSTTLSETTLETTSETTITAGEGSDSELVTTEKLSDSTPVKEEMHQQTFLENVQRIPPSGPQTSETPRWIIILGLLVGIAVVVIVGVAIATREKWIGPSQVHQLETQTNSSNQQRELEMKTFLNKDKPKENGKAGEYTIIPLDELPQSSTSH